MGGLGAQAAYVPAAHRVTFRGPVTTPRVTASLAPDQTCPLCGSSAQVSEGTAEPKLSLLSCSHCRTFVIEKPVLDVIMNARAGNLLPVLRHVAFLWRAAQSAAEEGAVLTITSTNWIRLAMEQQRVEAQPLTAGPQRILHATPASF